MKLKTKHFSLCTALNSLSFDYSAWIFIWIKLCVRDANGWYVCMCVNIVKSTIHAKLGGAEHFFFLREMETNYRNQKYIKVVYGGGNGL